MKLTLFLIILNVAVFLFSLTDFNYYIENYGFSIENFLGGDFYVLLTSIFLHGSISHLLSNMIALFFIGWTIEKNSRSWQFMLAYFLSGIAGNLAFFVPIFGVGVDGIGVGASGAIAGLIGLGIFLCPTKLVLFPQIIPLPFVLAGTIFLLVTITNLFAPSEVAHFAHLAGLFAGAILGLIWGENRGKRLILFIIVFAITFVLFPTIMSLLGFVNQFVEIPLSIIGQILSNLFFGG